MLVTNEGNSRFCLAGSRVHIALVGIEKLVPTDRDLGVMLNLLGRSATGQQLTVYTEFIGGPARAGQPSGPREMHVIFVDNGRVETLASDCREILRCIRCGACMNVCPVYRQASVHAYRGIYPGPLGAVLEPNLAGKNFAKLADLRRPLASAAHATRSAPWIFQSPTCSSSSATERKKSTSPRPARRRWVASRRSHRRPRSGARPCRPARR